MLYMGCWLNKYEQATILPSKICVLHHAHRLPSAIGHASSKITAWLKVHRWPRGSCLEFLVPLGNQRTGCHWRNASNWETWQLGVDMISV